ncbi:MAG: ATP-binding cassette domain-containing protein [Reyranellaceae bacterium]
MPAKEPERIVMDWMLGLFFVALLVAPLTPVNAYYLFLVQKIAIYSIVIIGLNLVVGFAHIASLGHVGLFAVGAYASALLTVDAQWPWLASVVVSAIVASALGLLLALSSLRLAHFYFAMVTLLFATTLRQLIIEWDGLTHGFTGVIGIPAINLFGWNVEGSSLYYFVLAFAALAFLGCRNLALGWVGRALLAIRLSEPAAKASGVSVVWLKVMVFVISAVLAGVAGSLYAHANSYISPDNFGLELAVVFFVAVILGGSATLFGPIVGAVILVVLPELLHFADHLRLAIYGTLLITICWYAPLGIAGSFGQMLRQRLARRPPKDAAGVSSGQAKAIESMAVRSRSHRPGEVILRAEQLSKRFGGVQACDAIDLEIRAGSVHGLIGPNGSGKTTMLNLLCGYYPVDSGRIEYCGKDITAKPTHARSRDGMARTFQTPKVVQGLTALDNVRLGAQAAAQCSIVSSLFWLPPARRYEKQYRERAMALLDQVGQAANAGAMIETLTHVDHRFIELARALMGEGHLLILDEPAAGLSQADLTNLATVIRACADSGMAVLLVEHNVGFLMSLADTITVLDFGRRIACDTPENIRRDPRVVRAYLGES